MVFMPNNYKVWQVCSCGKSAIAKHPHDANDTWCLWCCQRLQPVPSAVLQRTKPDDSYRELLGAYAAKLLEQWEVAA